MGIGVTLGHQYTNNKYYVAWYNGFPDHQNFYESTSKSGGSSESLISNLGLSYYGGNFFISLSNTGLTGMYDFSLNSHCILSPFGGISRLNYYEYLTYSYYVGLEYNPIKPIKVGASYSNSFAGQELNSINGYFSYSYKKFSLAYSLSSNKIYFEDFGVNHDRGWVHSFTLSYIII